MDTKLDKYLAAALVTVAILAGDLTSDIADMDERAAQGWDAAATIAVLAFGYLTFRRDDTDANTQEQKRP